VETPADIYSKPIMTGLDRVRQKSGNAMCSGLYLEQLMCRSLAFMGGAFPHLETHQF
jgi:hypothetical protein